MARGSEDAGLLIDGGVELLKIKRGQGQSSFEFEWWRRLNTHPLVPV